MLTFTDTDTRKIRAYVQKNPGDRVLIRKWETTLTQMGDVPTATTIKDLRIVVFLSPIVESLLVDALPYRSQESTLRALDKVAGIKQEALSLLKLLGD